MSTKPDIVLDRSRYDDANTDTSKYVATPGLTEELVREISKQKSEPSWMLKKRLDALSLFQKTVVPSWGPDLSGLDLDAITYFVRPDAQESTKWEDVPEEIRKTAERLGIPEAERSSLSGVGYQYDSDVVYHNLKKEWEKKGVVFENMDVAVQKYPELVKKYFMTKCIPINDHKFIMLHGAVWSGGTFIYVPPGVKVDIPLQAYFRMNAKQGGQFEHTLIIADKGSEVQYVEGCFTKGNVITTNPEYKPIESIKIGDKVLTDDGSYKKVKEIYKTPHSGEIIKIKIRGRLTDIEATKEHPFLYVDKKRKNERNKHWKVRWNIPPYFKKGDYLAVPINKVIKENRFYPIKIKKWFGKKIRYKKVTKKVPSTKEFFKLAGYYLAEGSISSGHYLNFSFGSHEKTLIQDVKKLLKKTFGITKTLEMYHKKNNGVSLVVCSTELCRIFEMFGKSANKKSIPQWMMIEKKEKQKALIKSYFYGDGNYYNKRHSSGLKEVFRMNTVSEKLAIQVQDILLRLGIISFINRRDRSKENRQTMYTIGISGNYMMIFGVIVGINIKQKVNNKSRASLFGIDNKFAFYPIQEITSKRVNNEIVYNFSVEDNETYCVSGVAVHNCSAPQFEKSALHAGCVELFVLEGAKIRYSSIENWSKNTYNLNTKRALVEKDGTVEWINGNMGSGCTMLYPCSVLVGEGARSDSLGIAFAGPGQNQDTGSKVIHVAPRTSSVIRAKSISKGGGISSYRGLVKVMKRAKDTNSHVTCDALLLDNTSVSNTYPQMKIDTNKVDIAHEARVGKIGDEEIFYLMSRGVNEEDAIKMIVAGFIEPVVKSLPLEYAVELNKLIELEMEGAVG